MQVLRGIESLPGTDRPRVVAVGVFDGVHLGHQAVLARTREVAEESEAQVAVTTFEPSPDEFFRPDGPDRRLTLPGEKLELLAEQGAEMCVVLEFDGEMNQWPCERFVKDVYVEGLGARAVVAGESHTFGAGGKGTIDTLAALGGQSGLHVERVPLAQVRGSAISSTEIRRALRAGEVGRAGEMLGRFYAVEGEVESGAGRGRRLGFPTANLAVPERKVVPADGVYAAYAYVAGERTPAAVNVGGAPTVGQPGRTVEAYLIEREVGLEGKRLRVEFVQRLRGEIVFDDTQALAEQIGRDVAEIKRMLEAVPADACQRAPASTC
ncbi:MAG: bifunctional riboflavin kinase/FAD synthetase [Armatimonadota bacterium]